MKLCRSQMSRLSLSFFTADALLAVWCSRFITESFQVNSFITGKAGSLSLTLSSATTRWTTSRSKWKKIKLWNLWFLRPVMTSVTLLSLPSVCFYDSWTLISHSLQPLTDKVNDIQHGYSGDLEWILSMERHLRDIPSRMLLWSEIISHQWFSCCDWSVCNQ